MQEQNFKNHTQMVTGFHYITFGTIFALLGGSINYLLRATSQNKYLASLFVLTSTTFVLIPSYSKSFPFTSQYQAIKSEKSLR